MAEMPEARLRSEIDRTLEEVVETRRHLHRHPELSRAEYETAALVAQRCSRLGFAVRTGVGGTGVVADLDSGRPGPAVMVRADMDALPIGEGGEASHWRSGRPGVMHACGHDAHVAIALGVAAVLAATREGWPGRLRMCFQPAEELAAGAIPMIDQGALDGVGRVLGLHVWAPIPAGRIAIRPGALFGSADDFTIAIRGRSSHGGMPQTGIDAVVIAAQIVISLQTIISRETSPLCPAVISIGRIEGGTANNIVAGQVLLGGTIRAFEQPERERLLARVAAVAEGVATTASGSAVFERGGGTLPVVSDHDTTELVRRAAVETVGEAGVEIAPQLTIADDMAEFLERVPGCYFLLGCGDPSGGPVAPHHSPGFVLDERCLPLGVEVLSRAALGALRAPS